ncbi:MAG TPA: hypothetical protein VL359_17025, partial [bacterium]|nr:hypothetical protein [bacterium]
LAKCREAEVLARVLLTFMVENRQAMLEGQETAEALPLQLPGDLAYLTLIRDTFPLAVADTIVLLRLTPAAGVPWPAPAGTEHGLDARSVLLANHLQGLLGATKGPGVPLARAVAVLKAHRRAWLRLVEVSTMGLLDQILRGTLLSLVVPRPPLLSDLPHLPEGALMCLGPSSFNQAKFHRILPRPDRKDAYMTLSEMSGWLVRLQRLREELRYYRDLVADIRGIIATLNVSVYEGAYIHNYSASLGRLDEALSVLPEELRQEHLGLIQERARAVSKLLREIYEQERPLRLRDRWLSRTIIRLKRVQPNARVNFADSLWEQHAAAPAQAAADGQGAEAKAEEEQPGGRAPDYQTFGERLRQAVDFLQRMQVKKVFVLSPNSSQRALTLNLIDQLFRL